MSPRKLIHVDRTRCAAFAATVVLQRADWFDQVARHVDLSFGDDWAQNVGHPVHGIKNIGFACCGVDDSTMLVCRDKVL